MKWLLVLIALMNILVFSRRNRLTRRSHNKSRVETKKIYLTIRDSDHSGEGGILNGIVEITYENEEGKERSDDIVTLVVNARDDKPLRLREDFFICNDDKTDCRLQIHRGLCLLLSYGTKCGLRYGPLQLVFANMIPGREAANKENFGNIFNQALIERVRNQYMEKVKTSLGKKLEGFELHRQELFYMTAFEKPTIIMQNLFKHVKEFQIVLQTENDIVDSNFNLKSEEMKILESAANDLTHHYKKILTQLSNEGVHDKEKLVQELKAKIFKILLEHIGVNNSKYEFVESNEKSFIANYCEKIYLNKINEIMDQDKETDGEALLLQRNIFNSITLKIIKEIKNAFIFGKKTQQEEILYKIHSNVILSQKDIAFRNAKPVHYERENLIFLRKIRFDDEESFLQKLSLIDSKRWDLIQNKNTISLFNNY
jgi:hypothetical protein